MIPDCPCDGDDISPRAGAEEKRVPDPYTAQPPFWYGYFHVDVGTRHCFCYTTTLQGRQMAPRFYASEKNSMGKSQPKRRSTTTRSHQVTKGTTAKKKTVNWTRILLIIIGVMIVISMILSMLIVPGSSTGF